MKKLFFLILGVLILKGADVNFVIQNPILSTQLNPIIKQSIYKGFDRQVWDFQTRIKQQGVSLDVKHLSDRILNIRTASDEIRSDLKKDTIVATELNEFIKKVNDSFAKTTQNVSLDLNINSVGNIKLNFKKSQIRKMSDEVVQDNNYNGQFKTKLNFIKQTYNCPDGEVCMPFYQIVQLSDRSLYIKDVHYSKPDIFFFEYFNPKIEGRRYILNIIVYIVTIDSDGEPNFEYEVIKDFNWRRNYRFISAQSGTLIREIITNKTGWDIR